MKPDLEPDGARRLNDMLTYANEAVSFADGRSRTDLATDTMLALALERAVEIVGEAAKNVSAGCRSAHPGIPWQDIIRTRDLFAHAYFKVDPEILWSIVTRNLPELISGVLPETARSVADDAGHLGSTDREHVREPQRVETAGGGVVSAQEGVLEHATRDDRLLLTLNRKHFVRLHRERSTHAGIIVCTFGADFGALAGRIHATIGERSETKGKLIRIQRPKS